MESPRDDFRARAAAQDACIRRFMSATGYGPEEWAARGYANAFAMAWDKDGIKDLETVYQVTLAIAGRIDRIVSK